MTEEQKTLVQNFIFFVGNENTIGVVTDFYGFGNARNWYVMLVAGQNSKIVERGIKSGRKAIELKDEIRSFLDGENK